MGFFPEIATINVFSKKIKTKKKAAFVSEIKPNKTIHFLFRKSIALYVTGWGEK